MTPEPSPTRLPADKSGSQAAWPIVLAYAGFAGLWILLSDKVVAWFITDTATMTQMSMLKGWLFVAVTSLFLFSLIRRLVDGLNRSTDAVRQSELDLRESESRLQATLDAMPDLLFEVSQSGRICRYHSNRNDLLAATPELFLGKLFTDILPADAAEVCFAAILEASNQGFSTGKMYALQLPQGERWFELSVSPLRDGDEAERHFIFIARDITQRKTADEKLQLAGRVFTHAREGIMVTSARGLILDVNEAFTRITGYEREEAIGRSPSILSSGRQGKGFYVALWRDLVERGYWSGEIWNRRKTGEMYAELLTISAIRDEHGATAQYVALLSDITELKEHQNELERVAHFDALTNLPNRILLADRLQQAMNQVPRTGFQLAVAFLDLDNFKAINDAHGHDVGDLLLIALAKRIKETLREGDSLARIGGDEFVAVLVDLEDPSDSLVVLERLLQAAAEPVTLYRAGDPVVVCVSASAGSALYPLDGLDADMLLRNADHAMYRAKQSGKNRFHLFEDSRLPDGDD